MRNNPCWSPKYTEHLPFEGSCFVIDSRSYESILIKCHYQHELLSDQVSEAANPASAIPGSRFMMYFPILHLE
jgi:hypothetical protein